MEELVTIAEYQTGAVAHLMKARLEAAGIRVYLHNENMNTMLGLGAVQLQVPLSDSFRAMDVLYDEQQNTDSES